MNDRKSISSFGQNPKFSRNFQKKPSILCNFGRNRLILPISTDSAKLLAENSAIIFGIFCNFGRKKDRRDRGPGAGTDRGPGPRPRTIRPVKVQDRGTPSWSQRFGILLRYFGRTLVIFLKLFAKIRQKLKNLPVCFPLLRMLAEA